MPSEERNYYCICDDNCKFPTMTYEQIIEAIAEATGNVPEHINDAFITKIKESNRNANMTFWKGTQAEFNALGVTAPVYKVGIDTDGKIYFTPYQADDLPAHASRHSVGGDDALAPSDIGALSESDLIVFSCGDGIGNATFREKDYAWLDTADTLNIPISKYVIEIDCIGFGIIATQGVPVADIVLHFSDGTNYNTSSCYNCSDIARTTEFENQSINSLLVAGAINITKTREGYGADEQITQKKTANLIYNKTVQKITVTAPYNDCNLQKCIIKFVKIKD